LILEIKKKYNVRLSQHRRQVWVWNIKLCFGILLPISKLQDILESFPDMKKLQKPKTLRVLCVVFRSLKKTRKSVCVFFTTVRNFFSCIPPNTQLTNHHTIIIQ